MEPYYDNARADKAHTDRIQRLTQIARMYYEQGKTQVEIGQEMGISRPLVSKMLQEARDLGIVDIRIKSTTSYNPVLVRAKSCFGLSDGLLIPDGKSDTMTNHTLAVGTLRLIREVEPEHLGVAWGPVLGALAGSVERKPPTPGAVTDVSPLVGSAGNNIRYFHPNENVRLLAQYFGAKPHYLFSQAFADSAPELDRMRQSEHYAAVEREWQGLDAAIVNIENHPGLPDLNAHARFGRLLQENRAVGRMLAYFYNRNGTIIESPHDYALQIPLPVLSRCKCVLGVCAANTSPSALLGAMNTGLFTHVVCREELMIEALNLR